MKAKPKNGASTAGHRWKAGESCTPMASLRVRKNIKCNTVALIDQKGEDGELIGEVELKPEAYQAFRRKLSSQGQRLATGLAEMVNRGIRATLEAGDPSRQPCRAADDGIDPEDSNLPTVSLDEWLGDASESVALCVLRKGALETMQDVAKGRGLTTSELLAEVLSTAVYTMADRRPVCRYVPPPKHPFPPGPGDNFTPFHAVSFEHWPEGAEGDCEEGPGSLGGCFLEPDGWRQFAAAAARQGRKPGEVMAEILNAGMVAVIAKTGTGSEVTQ